MSLSFQPGADEIERRVEALLFAAAAPLSLQEIQRRLPEGADAGQAIIALQERYQGRGVELLCVADRWQFRTAADLAKSRAVLGYEPKTAFPDGIDRFVAWFRRVSAGTAA